MSRAQIAGLIPRGPRRSLVRIRVISRHWARHLWSKQPPNRRRHRSTVLSGSVIQVEVRQTFLRIMRRVSRHKASRHTHGDRRAGNEKRGPCELPLWGGMRARCRAVGRFRIDGGGVVGVSRPVVVCSVSGPAGLPGRGRWERASWHMAGYGCNQRCN